MSHSDGNDPAYMDCPPVFQSRTGCKSHSDIPLTKRSARKTKCFNPERAARVIPTAHFGRRHFLGVARFNPERAARVIPTLRLMIYLSFILEAFQSRTGCKSHSDSRSILGSRLRQL